ncbi:hypothetical protein [Moorena sp. SIO1F2]|nr:hypothetical protein [Moorena sp. SIO1F2]
MAKRAPRGLKAKAKACATLLEVLLNKTGKHWNNAELRQHLK